MSYCPATRGRSVRSRQPLLLSARDSVARQARGHLLNSCSPHWILQARCLALLIRFLGNCSFVLLFFFFYFCKRGEGGSLRLRYWQGGTFCRFHKPLFCNVFLFSVWFFGFFSSGEAALPPDVQKQNCQVLTMQSSLHTCRGRSATATTSNALVPSCTLTVWTDRRSQLDCKCPKAPPSPLMLVQCKINILTLLVWAATTACSRTRGRGQSFSQASHTVVSHRGAF